MKSRRLMQPPLGRIEVERSLAIGCYPLNRHEASTREHRPRVIGAAEAKTLRAPQSQNSVAIADATSAARKASKATVSGKVLLPVTLAKSSSRAAAVVYMALSPLALHVSQEQCAPVGSGLMCAGAHNRFRCR